jgi:hypothetical protein
MPMFVCPAIVTSKVTCVVEAASLEEAKAKFKAGEWDEYDDDGGEVQTVECNWQNTKSDK